jgi:hypothetical protein
MLEYLQLPNPSITTVFRKIHYEYYIKLVIKNPLIRPLIDEAAESLARKEGSEYLASYLEKIREIRDGLV